MEEIVKRINKLNKKMSGKQGAIVDLVNDLANAFENSTDLELHICAVNKNDEVFMSSHNEHATVVLSRCGSMFILRSRTSGQQSSLSFNINDIKNVVKLSPTHINYRFTWSSPLGNADIILSAFPYK